MGSLTLGQIQDRVYGLSMDSSRTFILPAEITAWVNEAQTELGARLKLFRSRTTGLFNTTTLPLPTNLMEIVELRLGTDDDVEFVDTQTFSNNKDSWSLPPNTLGRVRNNIVELWPEPLLSSPYELQYIRLPVEVVNAADIPEVPTELQTKVIHYAAAYAKLKEGEMGQHDRFMQYFEMGLPPHPLGLWKDRPGPMNLVPDTSQWSRFGA